MWFLRIFEIDMDDPDYDGPDLNLIGDVLRYIFTFVPCFPVTHAIMALVQVNGNGSLS